MEHLSKGIAEPGLLDDDEGVAVEVDAIEPTGEEGETDDAVVLPQVSPMPAEERIGVVAIDCLALGTDTWRGVVKRQPEVNVSLLAGDAVHRHILAPEAVEPATYGPWNLNVLDAGVVAERTAMNQCHDADSALGSYCRKGFQAILQDGQCATLAQVYGRDNNGAHGTYREGLMRKGRNIRLQAVVMLLWRKALAIVA